MGIRGLESFLERQCPTACYEVNIKELIEKYKREKNKEEILIVVDGSSCLSHLYGNLSWIFGGQLKEFILKIKSFVDAFTVLGARLVFYFDGATVQRKRPVWISRRSQNLCSVFALFDIIQNGTGLTSADNKRLFLLPVGLGTIARFIFKLICGCEVRTSLRECDEEIAEFAQLNQCFAILGQDTDYVIYEGAEYYLSMKNLNITTMKTLCYDRWAFAHLLRIPAFHLPLFASLCGNDVIQNDDLKGFHNRECRPPRQRYNTNNRSYLPFHIVQKGVSNYIRRNRFGSDLSRNLTAIAVDVFKDASKKTLLESSLKSYAPQLGSESEGANRLTDSATNWMRILSQARTLHSCRAVNMYSVLLGNPLEICTGLEDFRVTDLPAAALFLLPLRQRTYGLLMQERTDWSGQIEEWCVVGTNTLDWSSNVSPVFPDQGLSFLDLSAT